MTNDDPTPAVKLLNIFRPSLGPCVEFSGVCAGTMRWDPLVGHVPRGWIASGRLHEIRLLLVTSEPGNPADGDNYDGLEGDALIR